MLLNRVIGLMTTVAGVMTTQFVIPGDVQMLMGPFGEAYGI